MSPARLIAIGLAGSSAAAMAYVGLYQARIVRSLVCPIFGGGCQAVADAAFARPFGVPDGFIALGLYALVLVLLVLPLPQAPLRPVLLALAALAVIGNAVGVYDMARLGAFCSYCVATTVLSPLLLWAIWALR